MCSCQCVEQLHQYNKTMNTRSLQVRLVFNHIYRKAHYIKNVQKVSEKISNNQLLYLK